MPLANNAGQRRLYLNCLVLCVATIISCAILSAYLPLLVLRMLQAVKLNTSMAFLHLSSVKGSAVGGLVSQCLPT